VIAGKTDGAGFVKFLSVLLLLTVPAYARESSCNIEQDKLASQELAKAASLTELYSVSKAIPGCMKGGGIAEEVSDDVVVHLSRHWRESLDELNRDENNPGLISFILRHIDQTTNPDDLRAITRHAKSACTTRAEALCRKIGVAANANDRFWRKANIRSGRRAEIHHCGLHIVPRQIFMNRWARNSLRRRPGGEGAG
jgi:diadenosine tetraphosphate (Ap4A) HIT family hydrolase